MSSQEHSNAYYIGLILINTPFRLLKYIVTHRIALLLVILIVGGTAGYQQCSKAGLSPRQQQALEAPYSKGVPSKQTAPQVAVTPSRYYYVVKSHWEGDALILTDFYEFNKKWERRTNPPLRLEKQRVQLMAR